MACDRVIRQAINRQRIAQGPERRQPLPARRTAGQMRFKLRAAGAIQLAIVIRDQPL
jgi:hypothetical protein